ncbi:hypothetical protein HPB50_021267 [Hyalomma asiaticum]|uniref:Uncharacterized protein n=1 Tax=Hyalomma asiaticum TaxID=266040 RepID=A0ACB7TP21_HYAAI|nr:hypothetical protein HPB50_021267 [Hyalomma asiaticum]
MDPLKVAEMTACLLKSAPLGILVIFGRAQTATNNYPVVSKGPYCTLLDLCHMTLLVVTAALSVTKGWLVLEHSIVGECISLAVLRESGSSLVMAFSLAITTSASHLDRICLTVSFLVLAGVIGSFLLAEIHDLVTKKPTSSLHLSDEDSYSLLARQVTKVLFPLFKDTLRKGGSAKAELPVLRRGIRCKQLAHTFAHQLRKRRVLQGQLGSFALTLVGVLWVDVLRLSLASVFYYCCILGRISALE